MPDKGSSEIVATAAKLTPTMTPEELDGLGVSTDVRTAARAFGIGKTMAYQLAAAGRFPCKVHRIGSRWVVSTADLRRALGITEAVPA